MSIEQIDLVERGLSRLPWMWRDKPNITGLLKSYLESLQEIEDILWQLNSERSISNAVGKQLDVLGALFSVAREGRLDEEYRQVILSRIVGSTGSGTGPDIKRIAKTITGATDSQIFEHFPASTYVFVNAIVTNVTQEEIDRAHGAGIRTRVCWFDGNDYFVPDWRRISVEANLVDDFGNLFAVDTSVGEFELLVDIDSGNLTQEKRGFTSLIPGAVGYEVVDDRGKLASIYALSSDKAQIGYIIDQNSNYLVDQNNNNLQYLDFT